MATSTEKFNSVLNNEYFQLSKQLLVGIGQWPYESRLKKYLCRFITLGALLNGTPLMVREFFNRWTTTRSTSMHCITPVLTQILCLTKFFNLNFNESQIRTIFSDTRDNWKVTVEEEEQRIFLSYGEYAKLATRLYASCLYIAMVFFLLMPMAPMLLDIIIPLNESRPKHLVFPADYGISTDDYYILMMLHAYIGTFAAITIIVASDVLFICLVYHACSLFAIVKHCLENIDADVMNYTMHHYSVLKINEIFGKSLVTKAYVRRVAYGVICHNRALKYSMLVENTFTWSLFIILGINMMVISLTGFQVLTQKDRWDDVLICVTYMFGQLCHLFLLSLPGQLLVDESLNVRHSVNKSYNFEIPVTAQKMLIPILVRSMYPTKITAGRFFVLDMETFMSVIQTSVSYFTVLANFY